MLENYQWHVRIPGLADAVGAAYILSVYFCLTSSPCQRLSGCWSAPGQKHGYLVSPSNSPDAELRWLFCSAPPGSPGWLSSSPPTSLSSLLFVSYFLPFSRFGDHLCFPICFWRNLNQDNRSQYSDLRRQKVWLCLPALPCELGQISCPLSVLRL